MQTDIDIVIPLSAESRFDNLELRMALRSIASCARRVGRVYVVCETLPEWCRRVVHLKHGDKHRSNKDANLFAKLLYACRRPELSERFLFWSDDQLALREFDAAATLPVFNRRGPDAFTGTGRWHRRMRNTFAFLGANGIRPGHNWDSHVPQPIRKKRFLELVAPLDYITEPGFCINTLYFGLMRTSPVLPQSLVKLTCESTREVKSLAVPKLYLGYNDHALEHGLIPLLKARFPMPCRYEKEYGEQPEPRSS